MNRGIALSKEGIESRKASPKDFTLSSKYDTFKIKVTGTMTLNLSSETFGASELFREHTSTVAHGLSYIPVYLPRSRGVVSYTNANVQTGASFVLNDLDEQDIPVLGYGASVFEFASMQVTSTNLVLRVHRENSLGVDRTFGARTVTVYYTLFINELDEGLNLL